MEKGTFSFSLDKTTWKPFEEMFGGEAGLSLGLSDEVGPTTTASLKLDPK